MSNTSRGVTVVAKLLGGSKIEKETEGMAKGYKKLGESVKRTDREAGDASRGWGLFTNNVRKAGEQSRKTHGMMKGLVGGAAGILGGVGLVSGIKSVTDHTSELAEETHKFHAITGMSTSSSLDYVAALRARGVGAQAGGNAFGFLTKNIQTAEKQEHSFAAAQGKATAGTAKRSLALQKALEGGKSYAIAQAQMAIASSKTTGELGVQAKAFKELGVNIAGFAKLPAETKWRTVTEAFEHLPAAFKKTGEQARLMKQIFGKGGTGLAGFLEGGPLGGNKQLEMAKKFFPTLKDGGKTLEELQVKQAESKMAWEGIEFTLGTKLIPVVTKVLGWFSKLTLEVEKGKGTWGEIGKVITYVVGTLETGWKWFEKSKTAVTGLKVALGFLAAAWAVEKIVAFYRAVKSLWLLQQIAKGVGGVWRRVGVTAAGEAAAGLKSKEATGGMGVAGKALGAALGIGMLVELNNRKGEIDNYLAKEIGGPFKKGANPIDNSGLNRDLAKKIIHTELTHHVQGPLHGVMPPKLGWGGTIRHGGSVVVGDRGPEMLTLPAGARVDPLASQTRGPGNILGGFVNEASGAVHIHVEVEGREIAQAVWKQGKQFRARM